MLNMKSFYSKALSFVAVVSFILLINRVNNQNNIHVSSDNESIDIKKSSQLLVEDTVDEFTEEKFVQLLKDMNFKYPHIVYSQSILETGNFKSKIFLDNNNLFGMKEPRIRLTTAKGTQHNHACYDHWRESVYDYALYQSSYLRKLNEEEYYRYLDERYAEAEHYVPAVKRVMDRYNVKDLFDS